MRCIWARLATHNRSLPFRINDSLLDDFRFIVHNLFCLPIYFRVWRKRRKRKESCRYKRIRWWIFYFVWEAFHDCKTTKDFVNISSTVLSWNSTIDLYLYSLDSTSFISLRLDFLNHLRKIADWISHRLSTKRKIIQCLRYTDLFMRQSISITITYFLIVCVYVFISRFVCVLFWLGQTLLRRFHCLPFPYISFYSWHSVCVFTLIESIKI